MDQLNDILLELGFTNREAAIYMFLLTRGPNAASVIAKNTEIERSRSYAVLEKMVQKGILSQIVRNRLTYFSVIDPEVIINKFRQRQNFLAEKLQLVQQQLRDFTMREGRDVARSKVQYYSSLEGINNILEDVLVSRPKLVLGYIPRNFNDHLDNLSFDYAEIRSRKNIFAKAIYPIKSVNYVINRTPDFEVKRESKILPEIFDFDIGILLYDGKTALISIRDRFGLLIESSHITNAQIQFFDFIWRWAKKYN